MSFVHLHLHSQYSLLEATCRADDIAKTAARLGMPAVALTDNGNMFGAIEFYFACKKAGVKPILGLEVYLAPKSRLVKGEDRDAASQPNRRLVLLAQNYQGYQNLCQISTIGYQEGFYYKPRVDYEVLEKFHENLIALSGGLLGEIPHTFLNIGEEEALKRIERLKEIFGDRFYLEMNRTGRAEWDRVNPFLIQASAQTGVKLVAANDIHYMQQSDQLPQEVLICIGTNKTIQDESRLRLGSDQFYFKSAEQMRKLFEDVPEACENTLEIANRCQIDFHLTDSEGKPIYHLPSYPTTGGVSLTEEIRRMAFEGLEVRLKEAEERGEPVTEEERPKYVERLNYELGVIDRMGFNGYFLIVQDFINWAKKNGVPVGPGRGSGAGSLVAYCLMITDLDPMPYHLIFERFLNPERISMPDFDIDFCQERRQDVINYVTERYGRDSVSQIITYGKLQARAAIRDVGRVLGMTYSEVDVISKLMPEKLGITIQEAIEMEPRLREQMEMNPQVATLMDLAQRIEGLVRHAGIHAAGVVIADGRLVAHAPLYRGSDGENVVQYDMKHAEKIGLIKFDFLGLKTLTHIKDALDLVHKNRGKRILPKDIPLSDAGIYEIMSSGDTIGVFQFEGEGITDALRKVKPSRFEDIVAVNALYRPGPMDMIPDYIKRKHGESKVEYIFPELQPILEETYGVIIYQEQVQLIAARIANYSLGEADMLRRAMGKKIPEEMAKQKDRFLRGAKESGHDLKKAEQLFDLMAEFAKYGFNKSHAAAYCVIAAQTAWLKKYYPVEFFAALLSTEMSDTDKVVKYMKRARRRGIEVRPPHINHSDYKFNVKGDMIYYSLGAIKGVGEGAVEAIIEARGRQPEGQFASLEEFFESVDLRRVNKKVVECLIKAGALDGFGAHRAQLLAGYSRYLDAAEKKQADAELGQESLFSLDEDEADQRIQLADVEVWTRKSQLAYEKEVLGFYLSDHPLNGLENIYKSWADSTVEQLPERENKKRVILAGLISDFKEFITKKGTRMAFAGLEDLTGQVELVVFPDVYAESEMILKSEDPILLAGTLEKDEDSCKILVEKVKKLDDVLQKAGRMVFRLNGEMTAKLDRLKEIIAEYPGDTGLTLEVDIPELNKKVELDVKEPRGVGVCPELFERIHQLFGSTEAIEVRSV